MEFPAKQGTWTIVLKVTRFENIVIVKFDPTIVEVKDIVVKIIRVGFFMNIIHWLKTISDVNGQHWSILQNLETRFYFTRSWPFETS